MELKQEEVEEEIELPCQGMKGKNSQLTLNNNTGREGEGEGRSLGMANQRKNVRLQQQEVAREKKLKVASIPNNLVADFHEDAGKSDQCLRC